MSELYAQIKKGQRYETQNSLHQEKYGYPYFKVEKIEIQDSHIGDVAFAFGGVGGKYEVSTLAFYVKVDDNFLFIGNAPKKDKLCR